MINFSEIYPNFKRIKRKKLSEPIAIQKKCPRCQKGDFFKIIEKRKLYFENKNEKPYSRIYGVGFCANCGLLLERINQGILWDKYFHIPERNKKGNLKIRALKLLEVEKNE